MAGFWDTFGTAAQRLDDSSIFQIALVLSGGWVLKENLPIILKYRNERLEINRQWDHNNRRLQNDLQKRFAQKEDSAGENKAGAKVRKR